MQQGRALYMTIAFFKLPMASSYAHVTQRKRCGNMQWIFYLIYKKFQLKKCILLDFRYVAKGRGELLCSDPMTVRLNFEPSGRPSSEYDQYYLLDKSNNCVVCGNDESYLRKNIVPHEYRKHFPTFLKVWIFFTKSKVDNCMNFMSILGSQKSRCASSLFAMPYKLQHARKFFKK